MGSCGLQYDGGQHPQLLRSTHATLTSLGRPTSRGTLRSGSRDGGVRDTRDNSIARLRARSDTVLESKISRHEDLGNGGWGILAGERE